MVHVVTILMPGNMLINQCFLCQHNQISMLVHTVKVYKHSNFSIWKTSWMKSKFDTSLYLPQFMNMESMSSTQGAHGFSSSWKTFWVYRYSSSALQHPSIARWLPSTDTTAHGRKKTSYRSTLSIRFKGHLAR